MSDPIRLVKDDYSLQDDDWIAECLSLQPERSLRFPRTSTSWDALCVLYLLSHIESSYWLTEEHHRRLANQAYRANYEGEWETVQQLLEQYPKTPKEFYEIFLRFHSPEEFFGNIVPRARRLSRVLDSKLRDPHGPVSRPQRHRGYRDKGTLRPSHQPAVVPPSHDEKVDRRKNCHHPLIYEKEENADRGGSSA